VKLKVDPREQRAFSAFLKEFSATLSKRNAAVIQASERLQTLWADARFLEFKKKMIEADQLVREFDQKARIFDAYLDSKALAGERYLRR